MHTFRMQIERDDGDDGGHGHRMIVTNAGNAIDVRAIPALVTLVALTAAAVFGAIKLRGYFGAASAILAIGFGFYLSMIAFTMLIPLIIIRLGRRGFK